MSTELGPKTRALQSLQSAGFPVPPFVGIPFKEFSNLPRAIDEAHKHIQAISYAVRSSALMEDQAHESGAGYFHSELNVKPERLLEAAQTVLEDAKSKLGRLNQFSLIIQEFIEFDEGGLCFTRDPLGTPEMVVETVAGSIVGAVSGESTPRQERLSWKDSQYPEFKAIEHHFGHPQDIEWGRRAGSLYIVQSRPITTLNEAQLKQIRTMEAALPSSPYHWVKNELTELAPTPCSHTLQLLKSIYKEDGAVHRVYSKLGVDYHPCPFLRLLDGELYVDKQAETKLLFPDCEWKDGKIRPKNLWTAWKRMLTEWRLARLKGLNVTEIEHRLIAALKQPDRPLTMNEFLKEYELIFEANLMAAATLHPLKLKHKKGPALSTLLSQGALLIGLELPIPSWPTQPWKGNGLDLADKSPFLSSSSFHREADKSVEKWWKGLSSLEKKHYTLLLEPALRAQANREWGRHYVVKLKNQLESDCRHRSTTVHHYPPILTTHSLPPEEKLSLSPGTAEGILVDESRLNVKGPKILFTESLHPALLQHFDQIEGIVTQRGGFLSHLAIVARERGLPVLRDPQLKKEAIGSHYSISQ